VLVVDDNPVNLMVMTALLEPRGLDVTLAGDGAEAVALAAELHFDLILMDLQMPILDGFGATLQIRRQESSSSRPAVPVIAFSSGTPGTEALSAHGLSGCLVKPCAVDDLEDCLLRWCPTYRPAPTAHHGQRVQGRWPTQRRSPAAGSVPAR
jgi:CheY-like chemotaxis protein